MDGSLLYLAVATLFFWVVIWIDLSLGNRSVKFLKALPPPATSPSRKVSIIIPARNEERNVKEALTSVLGQEYGNLEIIVVDDR